MRKMINSVLRKWGYQISRVPQVRRGFHASHLPRICQPKTVIDVGVAHGTPGLYEAYPRAKFILVEPLREFESTIGEIAKKYDCIVYYKAVGRREGVAEMNIDTENLRLSSLRDRLPPMRAGGPPLKKQVEVTTLDAIARENETLQVPILLKIDAVGYELEVLHGAGELLQKTDTVIVGVSVGRRFADGYGFEDLVSFMKSSGFYVYDFLKITYIDQEPSPRYADVVFKRQKQQS